LGDPVAEPEHLHVLASAGVDYVLGAGRRNDASRSQERPREPVGVVGGAVGALQTGLHFEGVRVFDESPLGERVGLDHHVDREVRGDRAGNLIHRIDDGEGFGVRLRRVDRERRTAVERVEQFVGESRFV